MQPAEDPAGGTGDRVEWSPRVRALLVGLGLLLMIVPVAILFWPDRPTPAPPPDEDEDLDRLLAVVNPGYIGIETCAECHTARVKEFKTTRHFVACRTGEGVSPAGFAPGRGRCDIRSTGLRFEMTRSGSAFTATSIQATAQGDERTTYTIGLVYGAASKRDEMYFAWQPDGRVLRFPLAWLHPQQCWGADVDIARVGDTHPSCLECHNTWIEHVPGAPIRYRREGALLGVTCERCHGPGREHAEYHRQHPNDSANAILHPGTLTRERLMDVCAQCHGNTRQIGQPFTYRPGQPLATSYRTGKAVFREEDTTTNQVQYLGESKCYQKSQMTCITCHDPHTTKSADSGCQECHAPEKCKDRPSQPAGVRDNCVGCHMPQHVWMNSHFYYTADDHYLPVAPRSEHRIGVYPWAKLAVELAWARQQKDAKNKSEAARLAARLTDYWLKEAEQRRTAGRLKGAMAAYREALQITPDASARKRLKEVVAKQTEVDDLQEQLTRSRRNPAMAIDLLTRILERTPRDARAHGELGTLFALRGQRAEAVPHLQAVAKHDPSNCSGLTRLAWMAHTEGRDADALALCAQGEKVDPGDAMNHFVWGLALSKLQRWPEAEARFRTTLKRELTHGGANQGLSEALRQQGDAKEAVRYARRAARWGDPNDPQLHLTLGEAYAAARRFPEARLALERALSLAQRADPSLADTIRQRLRQIE